MLPSSKAIDWWDALTPTERKNALHWTAFSKRPSGVHPIEHAYQHREEAVKGKPRL